MVSRSGVRKCLLAGLLSGLLIGCGTKRSNKFSGSCSSLNAVGDLGSAAPKTVRMDKGEKYDPSSVILHFKAHSEKISIESRCNARLMHTLSVNNVAAPVDFSAVTFQLSAANQNALELHTSAHCFFRVWDPRDVKQLDNNHELAAADVKKILSDDAERYYLYKSLLASPQKLYAFSASGEPIEFEYKLKNATGIYAQFFEQIEGLNESSKKSAQEYVGREFSKTSFMLDELALDVCSADEKLLKRAEPAFRAMCTSDATIAQQIKFLKDDRFSVDFLRRKSIHNGKHKACISQSDLVVAPIVLTGLLTAKHAELINAIHSQQNEKMVQFKSKLTMSTDLNPPADSGTKRDRFVSEFYRGTPPSSMGSTCAWYSSYPAISMSHPTFLKVGEMMDEWKPISAEMVREGIQQIKKQIPETCSVRGLFDLDLTPHMSELQKSIKEEACEMRGRSFNKEASGGAGECQSLRTIESDADAEPDLGICPPGNPTDVKFAKEAARIHMNVNASLRLATVSALRSLENYRAASDEILLLPLASLKGVTEVESSSKIASTIKEQLNRLNQDGLIGERILVVENVDDDTIPMCRLRNKNSPIASGEAEFKLGGSSFANFSDDSRAFIKRKLSEPSIEKAYSNFEVRYLNTRCIGAGTQILYNGFREIPGLLQMMQFSDLSMVVSGTIPSGGKMSPTSQELLETGRAVSIPLTSVILGHEKAESAFAQENAARLIASGHLQVGYCIASAKPENADPSDVQYLLKKSQTKDLFCKATPAHNGYLELVKARKSDYQLGTELESILSELDEYSPEYGVYLSNLISDKMSTKAVADALPRMYGHMNFITAIPHWLPPNEKAKYGVSIEYIPSFEKNSGRYFLTSGDSGTTISVFGLFPMFMLSTVQDVPVSGGISVVPSTSGQDVQSGNGSNCR